MKFRNETYNILKWVVMIALPALGTFYFAIAKIWGLPYGTEIVGTISAITVFLGALIGVSTQNYNSLEESNASAPELDDMLENPFGDYDIEEGDENADS